MSAEMEIDEAVEELSGHGEVHSVILFGSRAKGGAQEDSDVDLCVIEEPGAEITLEDKLDMTAGLDEKFDVSFFRDLPINVRARVLKEGEIVYTEDDYYVYSLVKETSFELPKYRKMQEEYHKNAMKKARTKAR